MNLAAGTDIGGSPSIGQGMALATTAPKDLERAPVARRAAVGDDDPVRRLFGGADAGEADADCHVRYVLPSFGPDATLSAGVR